jgi:Family of unknown function (DUF5681)
MGKESDKGKVGFRHPPRSTRFPKGSSGNPKGRPRRTTQDSDILTLLHSALNERVTVHEGGERKSITKAAAMVKQLVNKGASGEASAIKMLLTVLHSLRERLDSAEAERAEEVTAQMLLLDRLTLEERHELRRLVAKAQGESEENDSDNSDVVNETIEET